MDAESLSKLVAEQAAIISELRSAKKIDDEKMKNEMLQTLRTELLSMKEQTTTKTTYLPTSGEYDDDADSYASSYGDDLSQNDLQDAPEQNTMIVRSNSMPQHLRHETKTQVMASTGKVRASKNRKQHSSVSGDDAHSVTTDDSPFSLSANPSKQNINNAVKQKKKKKNQSNRNKQVPLVPTTAALGVPAENDNIKLNNTTMKFLHQSAALVGDAVGKDKNALMAQTFSQPLPAKKKKKKKVKSGVEVNDGVSASGSVSFENDGTDDAISAPNATTTTQNNNAWFPAAGGGLNVVRERKSPSKPNSRMQSRGMISTSGSTRSAKKSTRPRTVGPSTVATVRSEAESLGAKLLGPLNLDGERKKAPLPVSLEEGEWENELARNILSLYSNQVVEELKAKKEAEVEAGKRKTRKLRRVKELKAKGKSDQEIEEIIRSERFSRKTRKSSMMKTAGSSGSGMTSAAMDVLGQLTSQEGYELPDEIKQSSFEESGAGGESRTQSRKSKFSRSSTRGTRVSMDSKGSTTVGSPNSSPQKDKIAADKAVVAPVRPKPIWFGGTGAIQAEWGALEEFAKSKTLRKDLEALKEKGRYSVYIATIEGLLSASMRVQADVETTQLMERLWRQMVVTCNAFGVRCLEQKKYPKALELLERANDLAGYEDIIPHHLVQELKAFVMDSFAYYYMRRNKPSAALQYITNAMKAHNRRRDWPHVAKCHLHTASILSKLERHDEAIRCLGQVLAMVDDGLLEVGSNNAQQLLLVSVAYHNIAVEQLILRHVSEACVSSQNARRLARLCLSYSNRYLPNFEATHVAALKELAASVRHKQNESESEIFQKLAKGLYS